MQKPSVALIFPSYIQKNSFFENVLPPLGIEYLAAHIEDIADVELFDIRFEKGLISKIKKLNPDIVGVNVKTTLYARHSYKICQQIRKALPDVTIVTGGLHATSCPEEAIEYSDFVMMGDSEETFRQFVLNEEHFKIPGLVYRENGEIKINKMNKPKMNIDFLKTPARHLRKPNYKYGVRGTDIKMDVSHYSRGCTHACSFCSPAIVYPAKYRPFSPERFFEEVKIMAENGVHLCLLTDDHFGDDLEAVEKLCDMIIEAGIKIAFFVWMRPLLGHMDIKKKMVKAGFVMFTYGAESQSEEQVKRYGKGHPKNVEEFFRTVNNEWLEAGACYVCNSYVFGDTRDSAELLKNIGVYARKLNPTFIEPLLPQPFPATPYRKELLKKNLLKDHDWPDFTYGKYLLKHPELTDEEVIDYRVKMWMDFFSPKKINNQLRLALFLHNELNVSKKSVKKMINSVDYSLFGSLIEEKFYDDRYVEMVEQYFRETIKTFEPEEMDISDRMDQYTDLFGLQPLKKFLKNYDIQIIVIEKRKTLATMLMNIRDKKVTSSKVIVGACENIYPAIKIRVPLFFLKHKLASFNKFIKFINVQGIVMYNILSVPFQLLKAMLQKRPLQQTQETSTT